MNYPTYPNQSIKKKLFIFDLDGTLADTSLDIAAATNYACRELGLRLIDPALIPAMVGGGINKLLERALGSASSPDRIAKARSFFDQYYQGNMLKHTRLYPGIREVLVSFKDKTLAVLSNKHEPYTLEIVKGLGIAGYFQLVIGGRKDLLPKPAPDSILYILSKLEEKPENAVMIGDTEADIAAAKAAKVLSCAVSYGFRTTDQLNHLHPDMLIDKAAVLQKIFLPLNEKND